MTSLEDMPSSVEEAGALLGATITRIGTSSQNLVAAPKGMHSSFATVSSVPSTELLMRLYSLRSFLKNAPNDVPLVAAPSLLAVLMKLVSASTLVAAANAAAINDYARRDEVPPMISTPLRALWVDCVVLCHRLGEGLSGNARTSLYAFLKNMVGLAGMNPRSAKAAGGTRIAALDVIAGLFDDDVLAPKVASWAMDVLQLCLRALRSSGNGEPTYRISAMRTAAAVAKACRDAQLKAKAMEGGRLPLLIQSAMDPPAILEAVKILKQATADKYPEVRSGAATFAALLAPILLVPVKEKTAGGVTGGSESSGQSDKATTHLDDVIQVALRNIDDERAQVAAGWAEALARCICTAVEYGQRKANSEVARRDVEADPSTTSSEAADAAKKGKSRKETAASLCSNLRSAILFFATHFVRVGGELVAPRAGGPFSTGGRAVRWGTAMALAKFLRIQSSLGGIGGGERSITIKETILLVLKMSGEEASKTLRGPESTQSLDITTLANTEAKAGTGNTRFGSKKSQSDAGIVRLSTGNAIRLGISEMAVETAQLNILQDLIHLLVPTESSSPGDKSSPMSCNSNQLQVILIEISHLLATLGEASASKIDDLVANLKTCLRHPDHGVRHEASIACAAFAVSFPTEGRKLLAYAVDDLATNHSMLMGVAALPSDMRDSDPKRSLGRMFGRRKKEVDKPVDVTLENQYAIHGVALMTSIVVRDLPHAPGGLSTEMLSSIISVAESLVSCQFNNAVTKANPAVACTCVRAGFGIIAGVMATGAAAVGPHASRIFEIWQKSYKNAGGEGGNLSIDHSLSCLESLLSSIVAFVSCCSELLLSLPEALSKISMILEEVLDLFMPNGWFAIAEILNPAAVSRFQSAKASLLEAFAWLPSGCYPMAADSVFAFAAEQIRAAIQGEVTCSILPTLINKEDMLLDAKSLSRAERAGQVGGARDIEECIIALTSEAAPHGERESVLHLSTLHAPKYVDAEFRHSQILGMIALDVAQKPPTPLHAAVGTWRKPVAASCCSTVRLLDAAIQAFSATFGLKDGMEQQHAMEMLESLVPPYLTQLASSIGMTTALTEQASRTKSKEDNAAVANITAILLSSLKALPIHESTHNVSIGLGPPWMNKAKDLLLTLLPSASNIVRRAAAEGLALLATLGVTEDAHFLQSTVLHSLDEVMQGNQPDGKPRTLPLEPVSASRAGSLLTLACIQRTAQKVSEKKLVRTRGRALSVEEKRLQAEDELPTLQMMTRILPSVACHGLRDFFVVLTHALHAFGLLLGYSSKLEKETLETEDLQLLRKGVELVEDNFVASWTAASADFDAGQEGEKLSTEAAFLSVLLRLMALLVPSLHHLKSEGPSVAGRFSCIASLVLEAVGSHPVVAMECMAFFELLAQNQQLIPPQTENPAFCCIKFITASLTPDHPQVFTIPRWNGKAGCLTSMRAQATILRAVKVVSASSFPAESDDMALVSTLFAFLEATCSARCFAGSTLRRPLAAPRASELAAVEGIAVEKEATEVLRALLRLERHAAGSDNCKILRWVLLARLLLSGVTAGKSGFEEDPGDVSGQSVETVTDQEERKAIIDAALVFSYYSQVRWQVKSLTAQLAATAIDELIRASNHRGDGFVNSPDFNSDAAKRAIRQSLLSGSKNVPSRLVLHLGGILSAACAATVAAVDQTELPIVQESAVLFLSRIIACFRGIPDPEQPDAGILDQYATQIFSAVKHSLGGEMDDMANEGYFRRFLAGCEALQTVVDIELTTDPVALKRIIRPTIPGSEETPFFGFYDDFPWGSLGVEKQCKFGNKRAILLMRVGKLWTSSKLISMHRSNEAAAKAIRGLIDSESDVAVHCAAVAFDGSRLLLGSNATLCGFSKDSAGFGEESLPLTEGERDAPSEVGFHWKSLSDIDAQVKAAMAKSWSACACFALRSLITSLHSETETRSTAYSVWVSKLIPLVFAGLNDALSAFECRRAAKALGWAGGIDTSEVAVNCLYGISALIQDEAAGAYVEERWFGDIEGILNRLLKIIVLPALGQGRGSVGNSDKPGEDEKGSERDRFSLYPKHRQTAVLVETCNFFQFIAGSQAVASRGRSALLVCVLTPLDLLQKKAIEFGQTSHVDTVLEACLICCSKLISNGTMEDSFVKPMVQVALSVHASEKASPQKVNDAARVLLGQCLSHKAVGPKERRPIALELARAGSWETWTIVCATDDALAASAGSMKVLQGVLLESNKPDGQLEALSALQKLLQSPNSALVGRVMVGVGAEVLHCLKMFGTLDTDAALSRASQQRRSTACTLTMKIALVVFQQLTSENSKERELVGFLMVLFEYIILVLRFNGLPNHPPPKTGSDAALGKMAAQATLHIAKTAPTAFKATLAILPESERTVLEFAVRAEMTGYANTSANAPVKKVISLKGFKK